MSEAGVEKTVDEPTGVRASAGAATGGRSFGQRLHGALRLDGGAYDEIAADPGAVAQAGGVVAAAALARAIGSPVAPFSTDGIIGALLVAATWPVLAGLVWALGNWFRHPVAYGPVLRVIGFAMAPLVVWVLTALKIAALTVASSFLAAALAIAGIVVGTRQALRVDTSRAGFIVLIVALVVVFVFMLVASLVMAPAA
jgi:hypothetical protein